MRQNLALHVFGRDRQALDLRLFELAHVTRRDAAALFHDDLLADANFERRGLAAQALRDDLELDLLLGQVEGVLFKENVEHLLLGVAERAQDDGDRQLAAAVDAREHAVLRIELEVQP